MRYHVNTIEHCTIYASVSDNNDDRMTCDMLCPIQRTFVLGEESVNGKLYRYSFRLRLTIYQIRLGHRGEEL
jgi:hypothetical protein